MAIQAIRGSTFIIALVLCMLAWANRGQAQTSCNVADATIDDAYKVVADAPLVRGQKPAPPGDLKTVQLGDMIAVKATNLSKLYDPACQNKTVVLFLNDQPIKSLTPYPPTNPADNVVNFVLSPTDASKQAWTAILGWPGLDPRDVKVSIGFEDQFPLKATKGNLPILHLVIIPCAWFLLWFAIFVVMIVLFFTRARQTTMIRDGNPVVPDIAGALGTYSLAKTQGAWWFFIIVATYLLIGIITGDFSNSINSTALILLGIGAGTVLGSAAIDAQKSAPADLEAQRAKALSLKADLDQLKITIAGLEATRVGPPIPSDADLKALVAQIDQQQQERTQKLSAYRKLTVQSEGFLTDILSDANGISFHRFQIFAWTIVLSIIFVKEVYTNLAMPTFNATLMGLLGLSAGTYLGLKIPEPTVPK